MAGFESVAVPDAPEPVGLRWSDLAFSVSLANLCYLTVWRDLQSAAADDLNYFREAPLSDTVLVTLVSVALLSTGFAGVTLALRRWARSVPLVRAARGIVLLLAPLFPMLLIQQAIFAVRTPAGGFSKLASRTIATRLPRGPASGRVAGVR